jgi:stage IV sporulation protein FB
MEHLTVDWNWSFPAFRLFGVEVRIHWSLPAFLLYYLTRLGHVGLSTTTLALFVLLPMVLLFASVVAHEFGHVFAARYFKLRTGHMVLTPIGGAVLVAQGRTPTQEIVVALAGPLVNLGLALLATGLYAGLGGPLDVGLLDPLAFTKSTVFLDLLLRGELFLFVVRDFAQAQFALFFFNVLLAAYPMDGGRVLMGLLWSRRGFHSALVASCQVARMFAVGMVVAGFAWRSPGLALIGALVFMQAQATLKRAARLPDPGLGYVRPSASAKRRPSRKRAARVEHLRLVEQYEKDPESVPPEMKQEIERIIAEGAKRR